MPQKRKPPQLWLRKDSREGRSDLWFILDTDENGKQLHVSTGCTAAQAKEAASALADYITGKHVVTHGGKSEEVKLADVLSVYLDDKAPKASDPKLATQIIVRLNEFFGDKPVIAIKAKLCAEFEQWRGTQSGARRDLEVLRAAVNYYQEQHGLSVVPKFTMPAKSLPRDTYLTRSEAAALLWACLGWKRLASGKWVREKEGLPRGVHKTTIRGHVYYYAWRQGPRLTGLPRSDEFRQAYREAYARADAPARRETFRNDGRRHLTRLIIIGLYTGTRPGAILDLQKVPSTNGGYANLQTGVIHRKATGERVAHNKSKTPVKMAPRLLAHMKRWEKLDQGIRYWVHYNGQPINKLNKAFRAAVAAAGLSPKVTPHVLRHTRGTWLAQAGVPSGQAAASLGLTVDEYERTYLHNDPNFQQEAANAF